MKIEEMKECEIKEFQMLILSWYSKNKRRMPWREASSPYEVWVSEIMLQQTRVETVIPYYNRFIEALPTIEALAEVEEEELLKLWEGLGYYSRAKNMKVTARLIMENYRGSFPIEAKELQKLKGIGEYTAGAIASISFGERVAAVDGNVLRVISRLIASFEDITSIKTKRVITQQVEKLLPQVAVGDFNQALIEVGALICLPAARAKCYMCPINYFCRAYKEGLQNQLPMKSPKAEKKIQKITVLLMEYNQNFALRKRSREKLLGNLWEFPSLEGHLTKEEVEKEIKERGLKINKLTPIKEAKAVFTHRIWQMKGYHLNLEEIDERDYIWITKEDILMKYSMPSAFSVYRKFLDKL